MVMSDPKSIGESLVVDEAHRLKNHKTKLSQQIHRRIHWDSCLFNRYPNTK